MLLYILFLVDIYQVGSKTDTDYGPDTAQVVALQPDTYWPGILTTPSSPGAELRQGTPIKAEISISIGSQATGKQACQSVCQLRQTRQPRGDRAKILRHCTGNTHSYMQVVSRAARMWRPTTLSLSIEHTQHSFPFPSICLPCV